MVFRFGMTFSLCRARVVMTFSLCLVKLPVADMKTSFVSFHAALRQGTNATNCHNSTVETGDG